MNLSIIIPAHNVERYIGPCLESIYRQGLADDAFEVIIIDDASTDSTLQAVSEMTAVHHNISIITNEVSCGPSVCRNTGMEKARGEYVLFVDSDDLLMEGGLSILLQKALKTQADMVVADFVRMTDEEIAAQGVSPCAASGTTGDAPLCCDIDKTGLDYYVENYDPEIGSFIWRILYKRSFLNENRIRLVPGVYYEDIPFLQECYLKAQRVIGVHLLYYIYRIRQRSCTYSFTMKNALDYNTAIANSWALLRMENLPKRVRRKIRANLRVFFRYATDCIITVFRQNAERREIFRDLKRKVPELRFVPFTYIRYRLFIKRLRNWLRR